MTKHLDKLPRETEESVSLETFKKLAGHGFEQPAAVGPDLCRALDQMISKVPSSISDSVMKATGQLRI